VAIHAVDATHSRVAVWDGCPTAAVPPTASSVVVSEGVTKRQLLSIPGLCTNDPVEQLVVSVQVGGLVHLVDARGSEGPVRM